MITDSRKPRTSSRGQDVYHVSEYITLTYIVLVLNHLEATTCPKCLTVDKCNLKSQSKILRLGLLGSVAVK